MTSRAARSLRGAAFAAIATLAAATAHTLGGGGAPSALFCLVLAALVLPLTVALAGPRVSAWRTWAALGMAQLAFHVAFAITGDLPSGSAVAGHASVTGHATHDHLAAVIMAPTEGNAMAPTLLMTLAHVAAGIVSVVAVRHGEGAILGVLRWARHLLPRLDVALPASPARRPAAAARRALPTALSVASLPLSRRGPPAQRFCAAT